MPSAAQLLQSKAAIFIVGAVSFSATVALLLPKSLHPPPLPPRAGGVNAAPAVAPSAAVPAASGKVSWEFQNPEIENLMADLKAQRSALDAREKDLKDLEARYAAERLELNVLLQRLKKMQEEFDKGFLQIQEEETANLKRLAKMYAQMEPANAAGILKELDDTAIVKIMIFMKEQEIAPILETLGKSGANDTKRAARISEQIRLTISKKPSATRPAAP